MKYLAILLILSFNVSADVFSQWEKNSVGMYFTRATAIDGTKKVGRAMLESWNSNNPYGTGKPEIIVSLDFRTEEDMQKCKSNPQLELIRQETLNFNSNKIDFEVFCIRYGSANAPMVEIVYFGKTAADNNAIKDIFFSSNEVIFNGFKFPAKSFTKVHNTFKKDKGL